ncbi:hypothetical protein QD712_37750 [Streptomyces acidiscabies]|uniref:hypothetical protein n=1 Tax=Streptomyces acidiscabies TaxID=42234 RepID=UPI0030D55D8F
MKNPTTPSSTLPTTIWLPDADEPNPAPIPGAVLPAWALDRIRTDFSRRPAHAPARLLKMAVRDSRPGMDARIPVTAFTTATREATTSGTPSLLLAELHPDALPTFTDELPTPTATLDDGWPGFFHRTHRLLPSHGLLLLATRQRRDAGHLTDPLGTLIATARTAGFRYLQHLVVVYGRPRDNHLVATPPADASRGVVHCDLIALAAIHHT